MSAFFFPEKVGDCFSRRYCTLHLAKQRDKKIAVGRGPGASGGAPPMVQPTQ